MLWLAQSTALTAKVGPFLSATDGASVCATATLAATLVYLSKNGAAMAAKSNSAALTVDTLGLYACNLDATDTNTRGALQLWINVTGYLPVWHEYTVFPANTFDSLISASDALDVQVTGMGADVITSAALAASAGTELAVAMWLAANIRAGALSAAVFDTDAITSTALAASATTEITENVQSLCLAAVTAFAPPTLAQVNALAASAALTAYDPPTKGEMDSAIAALNDIAVADVWAGVIDTLDAQTTLKWLLAYNSGDIAVTGNAYAYKAYDASTTLYTLTASTTMRTRS